ncbi:MAG: CRISPR system precrRNA processing endoribonuclease RAMP protein Cas6 [Pleomorphochaeta sp.]
MIKYLKLEYIIKFEELVIWNKSPNFIIRSVLGYQLRNLTCVIKSNTCESCMLNSSCVYANFFETPIEKDKINLLGRNKAPHPFTLSVDLLDKDKASIQIIFIGISRNYIPYITLALEKAGENGVSKSRTKFNIEEIKNANTGELFNFDIKLIDKKSSVWPTNINRYESFTIDFITPCRIKSKGHFLNNITIENLLIASERRIVLLDSLYGDSSFLKLNDDKNIKSFSLNQRWVDLNYYSSRQRKALKIGGVVGSIKVNDSLNEYQSQLLNSAEIFNVGKNISMGLGRIGVKKED